MAKCNKIRHIVRIRQMLRSWRNKAKSQSASHRLPPDVPAGYVAICVGSRLRRFIVRASYLNHPIFRQLLSQAEEEYGFANYSGPLAIPCDESLFEEILRFVSRGDSVNSESQRCRHAGIRNENPEFFGESRPLLYGFTSWLLMSFLLPLTILTFSRRPIFSFFFFILGFHSSSSSFFFWNVNCLLGEMGKRCNLSQAIPSWLWGPKTVY